MGILGNLLLIVFLAIGLTGIGVSTYLVGSDGKTRWLVYTIFSVVYYEIGRASCRERV